MATSLALVILLGLLLGYGFERLGIPGLLGMLLAGMVLGPKGLGAMDPALMAISSDLRMVALIVILLRAGLRIKRDTLNRVGRSAALMSVLPSTLEGLAVTAAAKWLFGLPWITSAMMGFTLAAVSPAVVIPSMMRAMDRGLGAAKGIPAMILASASLDNAYVIVVFYSVFGLHFGGTLGGLINIPISIAAGIALGLMTGLIAYGVFRAFRPRATKMALVVLGLGVLLLWIEHKLKGTMAVSGILAVMTVGFVLLEKAEESAHKISAKLAKLWVAAEIILFTLVGAQLDIATALQAGGLGLLVIAAGLAARSMGTWAALGGSGLNSKEKLFCTLSFTPKATVQAAIGAIPLTAGVAGGDLILAIAVMGIVVTAPLGAFAIEASADRLLSK